MNCLKLIFLQGPLLVLALTLAALPALADETLIVNGKTASTTVRTVNGSAYVKVSDVAKALGMIVVKRPGGYALTKAGGTNQVQAMLQGKVGTVLFDGYWRFQVKSVETPSFYTTKFLDGVSALTYDVPTRHVTAEPGFKLVVVHCRMTNGQKSIQTFWVAHYADWKIDNALTDVEGESYPPDSYDLDGTGSQSKPLLPGAKADFVMLFKVPDTTRLKDLVFTLRNDDARPGNDVRVSLTP